MAGFFGLFGQKTKYIDDIEEGTPSPNSLEDFFLSADEAKSLGNLESMRASNSSIEPQNEQASQNNLSNANTSEPRSANTDLDKWRNIAREMKR